MNLRAIRVVVFRTFRDALATKWLIMFSLVFFLLIVNVPFLVLLLAHYLDASYFKPYLTYLISLSFPFLPLLSLPMGALNLVDERESGILQYTVANPLSRNEFLLGRITGLILATSAVIVAGYGAASLISFQGSFSSYGSLLPMILIAAALNIIMLSIAFIISVLSRRRATALGIAIFVWFAFTALSQIGPLGFIVTVSKGPMAAVPIILLNPTESCRILADLLLGVGPLELGSTGLVMTFVFGSAASLVIVSSLIAWLVLPFVFCFAIFTVQDIQ